MAFEDVDAMLEDESWLNVSPPRIPESVSKPPNRRARYSNIDDLLKDHYRDKSKTLERESKRAKVALADSDSSDSEHGADKTQKELQFEALVESCERQVHAGGATVAVPKWGERMFGAQRRVQGTDQPKLEGPVVQALTAAREGTLRAFPSLEEQEVTAEIVLSELLTSGWLIPMHEQLDEPVLRWIFHTMIHSPDKRLGRSACEFWCHFLKANSNNASGYWFPSYESLLTVFQAYGYLGSMVSNDAEILELEGPPHNIESFLRFLTMAFKTRHLHQDLSSEEVENLLVLIATLSLDRRLLHLGILLQECLETILNFFSEDEWPMSSERIAQSMAQADRQAVNCLRLTRSLNSSESRMKSLQRLVALHFLSKTSDNRVSFGVREVLSVFRKAELKNKVVDFVSLYYQMALADIWLSSVLKSDQQALESWIFFLKSCSCQISSTDWRPYASKVRNSASFLLQIYESYRQADDFEES